MNGLAVYEDYRTGAILYEAYMPQDAATYIIRCLLRQDVFFQAYAGNRAYCQADQAAGHIRDCGMDAEHVRFFSGTQQVVPDLATYLTEKSLRVNKFFVSVAEMSKIPALRAVLDGIPGVKTLSSGNTLLRLYPRMPINSARCGPCVMPAG